MTNIKLFSYPLKLIGITLIILGVRWMINDTPWMLDEIANVEKLQMNFSDLFEAEINKTLPGYLKQIYRFFGFWVIIIGLFITLFSNIHLTQQKVIAKRLMVIIGIMIGIGMWLSYSLIPTSHFIYLTWIMVILYLISMYAYGSIKNE